MKQSTCIVDACQTDVGPKGAKGMCPYHYRRSRPACVIDACGKVQAANGYCAMHNYRWKSTGSPHDTTSGRKNRAPGQVCVVEGCGQPQRKMTWCSSHYSQWKRIGEVRPFSYKWAEIGSPCIVCGGPAPKRRSYCGPNCQAIGKKPRPVAFCVLCHKQIKLRVRDLHGRMQRSDSVWCRDCGRDSSEAARFRNWGVTPQEYIDALARGCEICGDKPESLHVDHDHSCCNYRSRSCGECVRGFLCGACNRALGMMKDDESRLRSAIHYLRRFSQ